MFDLVYVCVNVNWLEYVMNKIFVNDFVFDQIWWYGCLYNGWMEEYVLEILICVIYDLIKMGMISVNCLLVWFVFLNFFEVKECLKFYLMEGNVDKIMLVFWVVIIVYDLEFYEKILEFFLYNFGVKDWFVEEQNWYLIVFCNGML